MIEKVANLPLSRFEEYLELTNQNLLHLETLYYGKQKNEMELILIEALRKNKQMKPVKCFNIGNGV